MDPTANITRPQNWKVNKSEDKDKNFLQKVDSCTHDRSSTDITKAAPGGRTCDKFKAATGFAEVLLSLPGCIHCTCKESLSAGLFSVGPFR